MICSRCNHQLFLLFLKNYISFLLKLVWIYRGDCIKTNIRKSISFTMVLWNQSHSLPTNLDETGRNKTRAKSSRTVHLHPLLYNTQHMCIKHNSVGFHKSYGRSVNLSKCPRPTYIRLSLCVQGWKKCSSSFTLVILAKAVVLSPSRKGPHLLLLSHSHNSDKH